MGSRQSTGKAGNAARTTRSRLRKGDGEVRLLAAELKRRSDTFQPSGPWPGCRPVRQWGTETPLLHTLKHSCDHYYRPSRVRPTHDLAPLCDIYPPDEMCLTKVL
jgi:hypothetical protein